MFFLRVRLTGWKGFNLSFRALKGLSVVQLFLVRSEYIFDKANKRPQEQPVCVETLKSQRIFLESFSFFLFFQIFQKMYSCFIFADEKNFCFLFQMVDKNFNELCFYQISHILVDVHSEHLSLVKRASLK